MYTLVGTMAATCLTGCNFSLVDTTYHFDKVMINSNQSSIILNVKSWKDYQGEQLQIITDDDFVLLTSSFDTHCFSEDNAQYSAESIGGVLADNVYDLADEEHDGVYNKNIFDTQWNFNKVIIFNEDRAVIIPVAKWKDYEGEQLQVITPFGMTLLLSSFNSKLVYDEKSTMKAADFAKMFVGKEGKVVDLSDDKSASSLFNYDILDTENFFNKVMVLRGQTVTIMSIDKWTDYEGEQLQLSITDGPTMLTSAFQSILVDDHHSEIKASAIASLLSDTVNDLSFNDYKSNGFFNKGLIDLNYGFPAGIISGEDAESTVKVSEWNDYDGEQLQIVLTETGDVILGTSMNINLFNRGSESLNTSTIAKFYAGEGGKYIDEVQGEILSSKYNKTIIDFTKNKFKYALLLSGDNVTILPLKSWKDFENNSKKEQYIDSNGKIKKRTVKGDSNCEQLQLILPDDTALLTTAYRTVLVDNHRDIMEIAELFRGKNGNIVDLTSFFGEPNHSVWNKYFFTKYQYDYAIMSNDDNNTVVNVHNWYDYVDGEQVQIAIGDEDGGYNHILTSYYNTILVSGSEDVAKLLSGALRGEENTLRGYPMLKKR